MNNAEVLKIKEALENTGIYIEDFDAEAKLKEYLVDSLTFVSFFIEIENLFTIELPDEFYSQDMLEITIHELINKILKYKGGDKYEI